MQTRTGDIQTPRVLFRSDPGPTLNLIRLF
jgi:hypothetical protein